MPTITARDEEILAALDKTPLTAGQLLALSEIFVNGRFTSERKVRARLQKLTSGPVRQARFGGLAGRLGSPSYYFLAPMGFRMLHGRDVRPHSKHAFQEIGVGRQQHTFAIADFVVKTLCAAHHFQIPVQEFYRENTLKLQVGRERLLPDCAFTLEKDGIPFRFMVEIDCGSEPIYSVRSVNAWRVLMPIHCAGANSRQQGRVGRRTHAAFRIERDRVSHSFAVASSVRPGEPRLCTSRPASTRRTCTRNRRRVRRGTA